MSSIHNIRNFAFSKSKLQGDDVRILTEALFEIFPKILKQENLKSLKISKSLLKQKKNRIEKKNHQKLLSELCEKLKIQKSESELLKKMWELYVQLFYKFMNEEYNEISHLKTWDLIQEFKLSLNIINFAGKTPKIHCLDELWWDVFYNGPCWQFETSPMEAKHKNYREYPIIAYFKLLGPYTSQITEISKRSLQKK